MRRTKNAFFCLKTSGKILKNWQINQPSSTHLKKSESVSTSTASPLFFFFDKIDKNVFRRLLRKHGFKVTDALVHRPGALIDTSRHAKSQIGSASSHRGTAGSSLHRFTGYTGSGHPSRRTRLRIAREPRRRPRRMPNIRSIALNPTEIRPLELATEDPCLTGSTASADSGSGSGCASPGCPDRDVVACQISAR